MVRLGAGLDEQGRLTREAIETALACLERFGQRLHDMKAESVRVVGTNTLRRARRKGAFLDRARAALGHPIEIISGIEEARLIYLGVAHTMPSEPGRRLVVDIGGGSTEIIIGEGVHAKKLESLYMGCVSMSARYLRRRRDHREAHEARAARGAPRARTGARDISATTVGTRRSARRARSVRSATYLRARGNGDGADHAGCGRIADRAGGPRRRRVEAAPAGAVRRARCRYSPAAWRSWPRSSTRLDIKSMRVADGALREGLLYDLVGRFTDEDARVRSVRAMQGRYHVDIAQAERVEATALDFLRQTQARVGAGRAVRRAGPVVGGAAARDRARRLAFALSQAWRVSARARGHAGISAGRAEDPRRASSARIGARSARSRCRT